MEVLIAHGSGPARRELARALQEREDGLVEVADGVSALELLMNGEAPRVALIDWDLPRLDGRELCRLVRDFAAGPRSYLILLASPASGGSIDAGLESGAHDFVALPVAGEELRARVEYAQRVVEMPWGRRPAPEEHAPAAGCAALLDVDERRIILRRLDEEVERARRDTAALSIALLHFEGLDQLRRREGTAASADVLREASRRLRTSLRPYDGLGWIGADEFLVTMPKTDGNDIHTVLDRLHDVLENAPFAARGRGCRVTAAIGGASRREHGASELLALARSSLDAALTDGPGCVVPGPRADLEAVLAQV